MYITVYVYVCIYIYNTLGRNTLGLLVNNSIVNTSNIYIRFSNNSIICTLLITIKYSIFKYTEHRTAPYSTFINAHIWNTISTLTAFCVIQNMSYFS